MVESGNFLLTFYAPSTFPSPPAYRQAGPGEKEGVRGKFQISLARFPVAIGGKILLNNKIYLVNRKRSGG